MKEFNSVGSLDCCFENIRATQDGKWRKLIFYLSGIEFKFFYEKASLSINLWRGIPGDFFDIAILNSVSN
ncbi:hypothetical protein [Burkholderia gladioli]|uniref:hypothetical protein n=1 Tax=Burkholderia gladioli TaxID=28095 RepID=UPI00163F82A8|nr:hypothetical protein [Burkholderia gladioli]